MIRKLFFIPSFPPPPILWSRNELCFKTYIIFPLSPLVSSSLSPLLSSSLSPLLSSSLSPFVYVIFLCHPHYSSSRSLTGLPKHLSFYDRVARTLHIYLYLQVMIYLDVCVWFDYKIHKVVFRLYIPKMLNFLMYLSVAPKYHFCLSVYNSLLNILILLANKIYLFFLDVNPIIYYSIIIIYNLLLY